MALNLDIKDPKVQRILASILVSIVAIYGFYHFVVQPKMKLLAEKRAEVVTVSKRVNDTKKTLEDPGKLQEEKVTLQARYEEMEQLLPSEEDVSLLLNQFSLLENDAKIYMVGFVAAGTVEEGDKPYKANRYRITIESGFHQFTQFMGYIMNLPRIMSFSELTITPNQSLLETEGIQEGLEDQPRNLTIECTLTSYVFKNLNEVSEE